MFPKGNIKTFIALVLKLGCIMEHSKVEPFTSTVIRSLCSNCTVGPLPILCLSFLAGDMSKPPFQKFPFHEPPSQQVTETRWLWAENSRTMNQTKEWSTSWLPFRNTLIGRNYNSNSLLASRHYYYKAVRIWKQRTSPYLLFIQEAPLQSGPHKDKTKALEACIPLEIPLKA